ncbi:MAG: NYN domain-containing protein [Candidatus Aminicenantes bacterium]|nr:NYN domain-containing protein [Candidatus Aminicenantes bacterium]
MAFIVDGNNFLGYAYPGQMRDPENRMALARRLLAFAHFTRSRIFLVFDGRASDDLAGLTRGDDKLRVYLPPEGETADAVIVELIDRQKDRRCLTLVSNDRELRAYAREAGAQSLVCRDFDARLKSALRERKAGREMLKPEERPSSFEVGFWMDLMEKKRR